MQVPSQLTYAAGSPILAADINSDVRDAIQFLLAPPMFFGYMAADQGVVTSVAFQADKALTELWDNDGMHSGTDAFATIQTQGKYLVNAWGSFEANTAGTRGIRFTLNGTEMARVRSRASSSGTWVDGVVQELDLEVGDVLAMSGMQDSGSLLQLQGGALPYQSGMSIRWIGLGD